MYKDKEEKEKGMKLKMKTAFLFPGQGAQTIGMGKDIYDKYEEANKIYKKAEEISEHRPILTISQAEPIGPKGMLDILLIAPCTGNTMAKLSMAITDSPVLMAAKSQLRTERPVVLSLASNDSLGLNFKNLGELYAIKHVFFVPFGQDDFCKKPNSLVAHMNLIPATLEMALEEKQIQPVLQSYELH